MKYKKKDELKQELNYVEKNIVKAVKPCCILTRSHLNKLSTQLRLYNLIQTSLSDMFDSSCCSCGPFQRAHLSFLRLHPENNV